MQEEEAKVRRRASLQGIHSSTHLIVHDSINVHASWLVEARIHDSDDDDDDESIQGHNRS